MGSKLAAFLVVLAILPAVKGEQTVCEIFEDLQAADGRQLVLADELIIGADIAVLGATACDNEYVHDYFVWPTGIALTLSSDVPSDQRKRLEDLASQADRLRSEGKSIQSWGRFVGRLFVRRKDGFPAELAVSIVEELKLEELTPPEELPVLSICEVFRDLPSWNGKRVALRAQFGATSEGAWLGGQCEETLVTDGLRWPSALVIGSPDYYAQSTQRVILPATTRTIKRVNESLRSRQTVVETVTHVGRLRTRPAGEYFRFCRADTFGTFRIAASESPNTSPPAGRTGRQYRW